uniref:RNA-dependent RNA polymerase n=1 Tax=Partiti-like lacotivirus TaxID=2784747 RepID=A0A7S6YLB8_9VIRU|nr:RNA-dependent RNA polymerase [Partiti-like lacotivirus]
MRWDHLDIRINHLRIRKLFSKWLTDKVDYRSKIDHGTLFASGFEFLFDNQVLDKENRAFVKTFRMLHAKLYSTVKNVAGLRSIEINFPIALKTRLSAISFGGIETRLKGCFEKAFPQYQNRLPERTVISRQQVLDSDKDTLTVYAKFKTVNVKYPKLLLRAIISVVNQWDADNLSKYTLPVQSCLDALPSDTSSCYPVFAKKNSEEAISQLYDDLNTVEKIAKSQGIFEFFVRNPCVIFHRFSNSLKESFGRRNLETKIRQIFGYPFLVLVIETMIFSNLVDCIVAKTTYMISGYRRTDIAHRVKRVRANASATDRSVFCLDISGMDKNLASFWIIAFFTSMFNLISPQGRIREYFFAIMSYQIFTPILSLSFGVIFTDGGNVSGSKLTSILNSFVVSSALVYCYLVYYGRLPTTDELSGYGDDWVVVIDAELSQKFINSLAELGLAVSATKSSVCDPDLDNIKLLGFYWDLEHSPTNTLDWVIAKTVYPERYVDEKGIGRVFLRLASVIFQIKDGPMLFNNVVRQDPQMLEMSYDSTVKIEFLDKRKRTHLGSVPLGLLRERGWTCY